MVFLFLLAAITGPTEAKQGELVILEGGPKEQCRWILPPGLRATVSRDNKLAFAPEETTTVFLVSYENDQIEVEGHRVTVTGEAKANLIVRSSDNATLRQWYSDMHYPLIKSGWQILYLFNSERETPAFEVILTNGYKETHEGYLSNEVLKAIKERGK